MKLGNQVSVVMMVCNEQYWIELALRPVLELKLPLYIADCASTDDTPKIIESNISSPSLYSDIYYERWEEITPTENGLVRANLAQRCKTPWILQVDGDELWIKEKLVEVLDTEIPEDIATGFVHAHNVLWVEDYRPIPVVSAKPTIWEDESYTDRSCSFILANGISQHRLHCQDARWHGEYPFESTSDFGNTALYFPGGPHAYHTRYLQRSPHDKTTFMRVEKQGYFDPQKRSWNKPVDLFGELGVPNTHNPYKVLTGV